jgi:hypothetical protein
MDCEDLSGNVVDDSDNDSQFNFEVSLGFSDIEKEDEEIMMDSLVNAFQTNQIEPELCEQCKSNLHTNSECLADESDKED